MNRAIPQHLWRVSYAPRKRAQFMSRNSKIAAAVFGDDNKPKTPEWKRIQEDEAARRQANLEKQKAARLARDAAAASSDADGEGQPKTPSQKRNPRRSTS